MTDTKYADKSEYNKQYYHLNKIELSKKAAARYQQKLELRRQKSRDYHYKMMNDPELKARRKAAQKRYAIKKREKISAYHKARVRRRRLETFIALGGAFCVRCGFDDVRALQIDHVDGGGKQHSQSFSSLEAYHAFVRDNPDMFQVLCANCNWIKRDENNENSKRLLTDDSASA